MSVEHSSAIDRMSSPPVHNAFKATNYVNHGNESQRVVDYFCVVGLPTKLTQPVPTTPNNTEEASDDFNNNDARNEASMETSENQPLYYYPEGDEKRNSTGLDPIVDLVVLNKTLNEFVPAGFECLWLTKAGHSANLNHSDAMFKTNHEMFICYRRGRDKPPITDIGIYYEGNERVMAGCQVITKTVSGNSANVNNSSFSADRIFVTYRRASELACNSLAVVEVCVIIKSKGEQAPHTFNEIPKNLNKGLFGASVFLCYKKAWIPAPQIKFVPNVLYRYPHQDHCDLFFPSEVAMFGLPMGAVIESWPLPTASAQASGQTISSQMRPVFSTFVLNVTTDDGPVAEKVYGASLMFYENYDQSKLDGDQLLQLQYTEQKATLHSNKCLLLLSRHALFEAFREFLFFLHTQYCKAFSSAEDIIPLETYLQHVVYSVPFPTHQIPRVLVNLTESEENCLQICLPDECVLPQSGSSYIEFLKNLGVDNCIDVFTMVLLQRNVMVHSLRRVVLTGVVEALGSIIFPFVWRYSYLPMCPLALCQLIEAPGSFILGMDSRFFDLFDAPDNVLCVDLDTNTISWTPDRATFNQRCLPKQPLQILRRRLAQLYNQIDELANAYKEHLQQQQTTSSTVPSVKPDQEPRLRRRRRQLELSIREAFLRFMIGLMANYKQFMRTVTRRPDTKAMDRNLATFFDCDSFVLSKEPSSRIFFREMTRSQLFYDCIMNLSFATELDPSLIDSFAFFSECCSKQMRDDEPFLDLYDSASSTKVILPPTCHTEANVPDDQADLGPLAATGFQVKDFIFIRSSAFVYNNVIASVSQPLKQFPRLKAEYGLGRLQHQQQLQNDLSRNGQYPSFDQTPSTSNLNTSTLSTSAQNSDSAALQSFNSGVNAPGADTHSVASSASASASASNSNIASNNTNPTTTSGQQQSSQQHLYRKLKVPNTPVGVRTNAEKQQAQRRIESILKNHHHNSTASSSANSGSYKNSMDKGGSMESRFNIARLRVLCLLSNSYALWFIYLAEHLRQCHENRKMGLNYAYQVLIQMQTHGLKHPDEICFRTMMQLCLFYKQPTLAVKTFLHMKMHRIELTPVTYSYYNMALIDPSNWPDFQQDRWAKVRLIWQVIAKFRQNLRVKREREERQRRANAKKKKTGTIGSDQRRTSSGKANRKSSASKAASGKTHMIKRPEQNESVDISVHFRALDSPSKSTETPRSTSAKTETPTSNNIYGTLEAKPTIAKRQLFSTGNAQLSNEELKSPEKRDLDFYKDQDNFKSILLNENETKTLDNCKTDLSSSKSGLLFISLKKLSSLTSAVHMRTMSNQFRSEQNLSVSCKKPIINQSTNSDFAKTIEALRQTALTPLKCDQEQEKHHAEDIDDPLNAFKSAQSSDQTRQSETANVEDIKRKLFDYKPFEKDILTEEVPVKVAAGTTTTGQSTVNSDFVFERSSVTNLNAVVASTTGEVEDIAYEEAASAGYSENSGVDTDNVSYYDSREEDEDGEESDEQDEEDEDSYEGSYASSDEPDSFYQRKNSKASYNDISNRSVRSINGSFESGSDFSGALDHNARNVSASNLNTLREEASPRTPGSANSAQQQLGMKQSSFETPKALQNNKFWGSMWKKVESSVDYGKIKSAVEGKYSELKEVVLSNAPISPLNQQEITSKLKSFSNYQINAGQYLNGLVKSNSAYPPSTSYAESNARKSHETPTGAYGHSRLKANAESELACLDLEPIPDDDTYKPISIKWWQFEQDGDAKNMKKVAPGPSENTLVDVQMSSCNICESCQSYLYDEEIMSGWSLNDSDLNVKCTHCSAHLVPKLYVNIQDMETIRQYLGGTSVSSTDPSSSSSSSVPDKPDTQAHPFTDVDPIEFEGLPSKQLAPAKLRTRSAEFTVEYLSPLVVRKEIENIILNANANSSSASATATTATAISNPDDPSALVTSQFMEQHAVIFWNLVWLFKRIGVDGSYLLDSLLNSRLELHRREYSDQDPASKVTAFLSQFQPRSNQPFSQHMHVRVTCLWDNIKLKQANGNHEIPLYISWLSSGNFSITKELERKLVTFLTETELKAFRKSSANPRSLAKIFEMVIRNIKEGDVGIPIKNLLRERTVSRLNWSSIYRELLYLLIVSLERYLIDIDAFDSEYRKAYRRILASNLPKEVIKLADMPPDSVAIWSRRLFSPLTL